MMQTQQPIKRALISVSDKTGIVEFAQQLVKQQIEILATGGTAKLLSEHRIPITDISDYTKFPEIMDGRVKTLHPKVHGALLGRIGLDDLVMRQHHINPIDLLVVNLYPFANTIQRADCDLAQAIEQIDIGGPSMLRSGAKNFYRVTTVTEPSDYTKVLACMKQNHGATTLALRQQLSQKVFRLTAHYDFMISQYLAQHIEHNESAPFPSQLKIQHTRQRVLRYGENPHQQAAFYSDQQANRASLAHAELLQGKPLSYNNMIDADCALQCVLELDQQQAACVIVKHATPCGAAQGLQLIEAYQKAYRCDPESAFGGIIAFNQTVCRDTVDAIFSQQFVEVLLAPEITADALALLENKPNLRVLRYQKDLHKNTQSFMLHSISGGVLVQEADIHQVTPDEITVVTRRVPSPQEQHDLLFAWRMVKYAKSNAIVFAKDQATLGIGTGQTSRVFSAKIAVLRAESQNLALTGAVMASDAFFPFADGIEVAIQHGVTAIIQPGGSKRDTEVIDAANAANIAMVFTGIRHFRH